MITAEQAALQTSIANLSAVDAELQIIDLLVRQAATRGESSVCRQPQSLHVEEELIEALTKLGYYAYRLESKGPDYRRDIRITWSKRK